MPIGLAGRWSAGQMGGPGVLLAARPDVCGSRARGRARVPVCHSPPIACRCPANRTRRRGIGWWWFSESCTAAAWVSNQACVSGDVVSYSGSKWTANQWNYDEVPGGASGAWNNDGPC